MDLAAGDQSLPLQGSLMAVNPKFECRNAKQARRLKWPKFKTPRLLGWFETLEFRSLGFVSDFNPDSATGLHEVTLWY